MKIPEDLETTIRKEIEQKDKQRKKDKQEWRREYTKAQQTYAMLKEIASDPIIERYTKEIKYLPFCYYSIALRNGNVYRMGRQPGELGVKFKPINLEEEKVTWLSKLGDLNEELIFKIISLHVYHELKDYGNECEIIKEHFQRK
ncbi:hypothetical protein KY348_06585 [Candidatus Woesearchaeota archaeon]|nr:hypothetical protein [Candidatus Woesearchaeota archaeon]